jgi:hypothetical protein
MPFHPSLKKSSKNLHKMTLKNMRNVSEKGLNNLTRRLQSNIKTMDKRNNSLPYIVGGAAIVTVAVAFAASVQLSNT